MNLVIIGINIGKYANLNAELFKRMACVKNARKLAHIGMISDCNVIDARIGISILIAVLCVGTKIIFMTLILGIAKIFARFSGKHLGNV